ncbi:unnamed protein product [Ophioblennius macclurei]
MTPSSAAAALRFSRSAFRLCLSSSVLPTTPSSSSSSSAVRLLPGISPCRLCSSGDVKVRSYLQYVKRKLLPPPTPPYSHVCQVGDPVLRSRAAAVDPADVTSPEIRRVVATLVKVMRRLECVGLSAPQIGVPLRILALEYPEAMLRESSAAAREARGLSAQPLRVFINPTLRVLDGRAVRFQEACESIAGFSATVPRFLSVEVSGLNENGEEVSWRASGWPARIVQHEMDHLDGVLYVDRMDSKTFINVRWQEHNE